MNSLSFKLTDKEIDDLLLRYQSCLKDNPNEYVKAFIKTPDDTTITIYKNGKVLLQGKNAHIYGAEFLKKDIAEAGSDEVGTGDYFGPICVCACIVEENDREYLEMLGINDSKKMNDDYILKIGQEVMSRLKHSLLIVDDLTYNRAHERYNLNEIKAKLHNQAYINLKRKGYKIPSAAYVDQFEDKSVYFRHLLNEKEVYHDLYFEIKAESKHLSVACASVIARYAFLKTMRALNEKYRFDFPFGSRGAVDQAGIRFCEQYGINKLKEVAKLHFKNTERIIEAVKKIEK